MCVLQYRYKYMIRFSFCSLWAHWTDESFWIWLGQNADVGVFNGVMWEPPPSARYVMRHARWGWYPRKLGTANLKDMKRTWWKSLQASCQDETSETKKSQVVYFSSMWKRLTYSLKRNNLQWERGSLNVKTKKIENTMNGLFLNMNRFSIPTTQNTHFVPAGFLFSAVYCCYGTSFEQETTQFWCDDRPPRPANLKIYEAHLGRVARSICIVFSCFFIRKFARHLRIDW